MVGASKILTVSYGTFSCTLEGFDDSFNTMKAIAEYFRDLAAEDRYFGAEPPAPDAEMLARIAEKEVSRRVEARIKDNNVVLRQQEAPALEPQRAAPSPIPPQPVARSTASESPRKPAFQAAKAALAAAPASADADSIAAKLQRIRAVVAQNKAGTSDRLFDEDEQVGEIAEELNATSAELQAAPEAAPEAAPQPVLDDPELIAAASEEADADAAEEEDALAALEAFEQSAEPAQSADLDEDEVAAPEDIAQEAYEEDSFEGEIAQEETFAAPVASEEAFEDEPEADFGSEATDALLKAVASRTILPEAEAEAEDQPEASLEADMAQEEMEADLLPEDAQDAEIGVEDIAEAPFEAPEEALDTAEDASEDAFAEVTFEDDNSYEEDAYEEVSFHEEAYQEDTDADEAQDDAIAEAFAEEDVQDDAAEEDADVLARLNASLSTPAEAEAAQDEEDDTAPLVLTPESSIPAEASEEEFEAEAAELEAEEAIEDTADEEEEEDEARKASATAAAARARARVIRMKKSDVEDAIADGTLQPMELVEEEEDVAEADDAPSSLSDEEEADLRAELAAVEAEERGEDAAAPVRPVRVTPRRVTTEAEDDEEAVARLLEQTNSKLEESEGARRRSGFAHLKAAVAATVAERKFLGGKKKDEDETEAYREDLAKAVKPGTPAPAPAPTPAERPSRKAGTMAPLMLVSEQRVDVTSVDGRDVAARGPGADADEGEVTTGNLALQKSPRREVSVYELEKVDHVLADDTSFAEFAARLGVTELPDLLEAAAAYVAYVEGRPQFSRPHVMGIMAKAETAGEISREDGLRSFGQLLREGRLQKVQRGQFTIAKTTRFKPKARYGNE